MSKDSSRDQTKKYSDWLIQNKDESHGTDFDDPSKTLVFYLNSKSAKSAFIKQQKFVMPFMLLMILIEVYSLSFQKNSKDGLPCMLVLLVTLIIVAASIFKFFEYQSFFNSAEPLLKVQPEGVVIRYFGLDSDFLPWGDIKEIRSTFILGSSYLLIQLKGNTSKSKILIPESWLHLKVDDLVSLMKFRSTFYTEKKIDNDAT